MPERPRALTSPVFLGAVLFLLLLTAAVSHAAPTHLNRTNVKGGCSECHKGHGKKGTSMLAASGGKELCFRCHSQFGRASDIYSQLLKLSTHRILETSMYHVKGEQLPETDGFKPRHASCDDCHNVHVSEKNEGLKGLRGYRGGGLKSRKIEYDYELCYNCHSDSANRPSQSTDISLDFAASNASFHPVVSFGRNAFVPSLRKLSPSSMIKCIDCHGNDDPSGPKGPHGSIYKPLLKYRYVQTPGPESPSSYDLCYSCHERSSILDDESFKAHKAHIVFNRISCAQCHDSHGSRFNSSLINFDVNTVFPNSLGQVSFQNAVRGKPRCYLSCHLNGRIYEHKLDQKLAYTVNSKTVPQW
ncbi:MAG: hypothetical protein HZB33_06320 [Nitrospirae bacterium]|nr:hypothetical protein [Nitrospirota bacterium]